MDEAIDEEIEAALHKEEEEDSSENATRASKGSNQQLVYDAKLQCYYDPHTREYFELK